MEQVQADGCTNNVVVEKVCDIGADERLPGKALRNDVFRIVKSPRVIAARTFAPARQACMDTFCAGDIGELDEAREPPALGLESKCSPQCVVEVFFLTHRKRLCAAGQASEPLLEELDVLWRIGQLKRIETRPSPAL